MEAKTRYNQLIGTSAADYSYLNETSANLEGIARYFEIDLDDYTPVGLSLYGTRGICASLICVDKQKSTEEKEHIVSIGLNNEGKLDNLFNRFHVVLYEQFDTKYRNLKINEEL